MRTSAALAGLLSLGLVVAASTPAAAAEGRADRETDHIDAFDDGGPRSFGLLFNPGALLLGTMAAEGDFVLGEAAAFSVEGDLMSGGASSAYGVAVGVPLFPWRVVFHGLYLHPRLMAARATSAGVAADVVGIGGTLGWQQTFRFGLTLRIGGGAAYEAAFGQDAGASFAVTGVRPLVDGDLGWVF
ncbi:MAG TPA: hypothetical protein VGL81_28060 [Polyangiaceae bacterium]|jgi:hypothetical protein